MIAVAVTDTLKATVNVITTAAIVDIPELSDSSLPENTPLYDYY